MSGIDKHEGVHERLSSKQVLVDHLLPFFAFRLRDAGEAIAGEVDKIPRPVDEEMVDELRLARTDTGLGEAFVAYQLVDERRLADI